MSWLIDNASGSTLRLLDFELTQGPSANGTLDQVYWGESLLAIGSSEPGALTLQSDVDPSLSSGNSTLFSMRFAFEAGSQGYTLAISFDAGCTLQGSW